MCLNKKTRGGKQGGHSDPRLTFRNPVAFYSQLAVAADKSTADELDPPCVRRLVDSRYDALLKEGSILVVGIGFPHPYKGPSNLAFGLS